MATTVTQRIPPLVHGDKLTRAEFLAAGKPIRKSRMPSSWEESFSCHPPYPWSMAIWTVMWAAG